jgi:hypothetical protein
MNWMGPWHADLLSLASILSILFILSAFSSVRSGH